MTILSILKSARKVCTKKYQESLSLPLGYRGYIKIDEKKCIGCGLCEKICPTSAIKIKEGKASVDYAKCTFCGLCVRYCPVKAVVQTNNHNLILKD